MKKIYNKVLKFIFSILIAGAFLTFSAFWYFSHDLPDFKKSVSEAIALKNNSLKFQRLPQYLVFRTAFYQDFQIRSCFVSNKKKNGRNEVEKRNEKATAC